MFIDFGKIHIHFLLFMVLIDFHRFAVCESAQAVDWPGSNGMLHAPCLVDLERICNSITLGVEALGVILINDRNLNFQNVQNSIMLMSNSENTVE